MTSNGKTPPLASKEKGMFRLQVNMLNNWLIMGGYNIVAVKVCETQVSLLLTNPIHHHLWYWPKVDSPNAYAISQAVPTPSNLKAIDKPTEPNPNVARYPNPKCMSQRQSGFDDMCKHHWNRMHKKPKKTKAQEDKEDKRTRTKIRFAGEAGRVCMMMHCREVSRGRATPRLVQWWKRMMYQRRSRIQRMNWLTRHLQPIMHNMNSLQWCHWQNCWKLAREIKPPQSLLCKLEEREAQTAALEMALLLYYLEFREWES